MITEEELAKLITALNKAGTPEVYKAFEGWFDYAGFIDIKSHCWIGWLLENCLSDDVE